MSTKCIILPNTPISLGIEVGGDLGRINFRCGPFSLWLTLDGKYPVNIHMSDTYLILSLKFIQFFFRNPLMWNFIPFITFRHNKKKFSWPRKQNAKNIRM